MNDQTVGPPLAPIPQPPEQLSFVQRYNIHPVVYALVVLLAIFMTYQIIGGFLTLIFVGGKVTTDNVTMHRLFTMGGQILFILLPTLVFARLFDLRPSRIFPWRMPHFGETTLALLSLLFLQEVLQIYLFFQDHIPLPQDLKKIIDPARQLIEEMFRTLVSSGSMPELLLVVLVVGMTPAIIEELLFRGLIQSCFERATSPLRAAFWTGLIFGVFHFNPFSVVPLIILGIFFGVLRMRSKSMVLAMTIHFINNALAAVVAFFNVDDRMVVEADKGADANIMIILTQLVLFLMLFIVTFSAYLRFSARVQSARNGEV